MIKIKPLLPHYLLLPQRGCCHVSFTKLTVNKLPKDKQGGSELSPRGRGANCPVEKPISLKTTADGANVAM